MRHTKVLIDEKSCSSRKPQIGIYNFHSESRANIRGRANIGMVQIISAREVELNATRALQGAEY